MIALPPEPEVPDAHRGRADLRLRYPDVDQDGRLSIFSLPHAVGPTVWQGGFRSHPLAHGLRASGMIPILSRLVLDGAGGPVSVRGPAWGEGFFHLAHSPAAGRDPRRIFLNMWVTVSGNAGRTYAAAPPGSGEVEVLGRVFAEHVFTRLFAGAGHRRVERLEGEGVEPVPPAVYPWSPPAALAELPAGVEPLEPGPRPDPAPVLFGLGHTDSNHHVNSLAYPRLFEEAALRRLAELGHDTARLFARRAEVAYRKPSFAGERLEIRLRAMRPEGAADELGCVGSFHAAGDGDGAAPRCAMRLVFGLAP